MISEIIEKIDNDDPHEDIIASMTPRGRPNPLDLRERRLSKNDTRQLLFYVMEHVEDCIGLVRYLLSLEPHFTPEYISSAIVNELHISTIRLIFEWCLKCTDHAFRQELMMIIVYSELESEYIIEFVSKLKTESNP